METATIEEPTVEQVEKLLIFSNETEISKLTQDAQIRARLLNDVLACGLSPTQIKDIAISEKAIENFLFQRHLQQNKLMAQEFASGKRQSHLVEAYLLPDNLQHIQRQLLQFFNSPTSHRGADKYQHLKFIESRFELDNQALEKEFIMRKIKVYIVGEDVAEWRQLELFCEHFKAHKIEVGQIKCNFFDTRLQPIGQASYIPRWTWFMRER